MPSLPWSHRQFQHLCVSISSTAHEADWSVFHLSQAATQLPVLPFQHSPRSHQQELEFQAVQDHSPAVQAEPDGTTMPRTTVIKLSEPELPRWCHFWFPGTSCPPKKLQRGSWRGQLNKLWATVPLEQGGKVHTCVQNRGSAHRTPSSCSGVSLLDCDGATWQHWGSGTGMGISGNGSSATLWFREQPLILHFFNSLIL